MHEPEADEHAHAVFGQGNAAEEVTAGWQPMNAVWYNERFLEKLAGREDKTQVEITPPEPEEDDKPKKDKPGKGPNRKD